MIESAAMRLGVRVLGDAALELALVAGPRSGAAEGLLSAVRYGAGGKLERGASILRAIEGAPMSALADDLVHQAAVVRGGGPVTEAIAHANTGVGALLQHLASIRA